MCPSPCAAGGGFACVTRGVCLCRDSGATVKRVGNSAYPRVISNLGALADAPGTMVALTMIRFMNHFARTVRERMLIINFLTRDEHVPPRHKRESERVNDWETLPLECQAFASREGGTMGTRPLIGMMYDYFGVGYANTLGYAHANTGDTMTSVMIGGLRTVMNGDFELFTGDLVQFYWCFEKDDFLPDGRRKPYLDIWDGDVPQNVDPSTTTEFRMAKRDREGRETWGMRADAQIRQAHYDLSYGQRPNKSKIVAKIKPYIPDDENPRLMDWYRVFGVAIACARPNEMCDIKIARQSM